MKPILAAVTLWLSCIALLMADDGLDHLYWWVNGNVTSGWDAKNGFAGGFIYEKAAGNSSTIEPTAFAVFSADYSKSVSIPISLGHTAPITHGFWGQLPDFPTAELSKLGPGTYHAAFLHDGIRASNIITLTVQNTPPALSGPSLQVAGVADLQNPQISALQFWITPPDNGDPALTYQSVIRSSKLIIDGVPRHCEMNLNGRMKTGPIPAHASFGHLLDLSKCDPPVTPSATHQVQVIIGQYKSPVTTVSIDPALDQKFDAALAKATAPVVKP